VRIFRTRKPDPRLTTEGPAALVEGSGNRREPGFEDVQGLQATSQRETQGCKQR